jgi:hypothetical protein
MNNNSNNSKSTNDDELLNKLLSQDPYQLNQKDKVIESRYKLNIEELGLLVTILSLIAAILVVPEFRAIIRLDNPQPKVSKSFGYLFYPSCTFVSEEPLPKFLFERPGTFSNIDNYVWATYLTEKAEQIGHENIKLSSVPQLLVTTPKDIIIKEISLEVIEYTLPPVNLDTFSATIVNGCPLGSGPLPGIDLDTIIINPHPASYKLTPFQDDYFNDSYLPYKLDAGDAVMLNPFVVFSGFGHYRLQIELTIVDINRPEEGEVKISSPNIDYRAVMISSEKLRTLPSISYGP